MIHDPHYAIMTVSNLATEHPKEVSRLLDAAQALDAVGNYPLSWAGITDLAKVEKVILAHAQYNATTGEAFAQAKESSAGRIRMELTQAVADHRDWYLEQREEQFNATAQAYLEAVSKLPEEFTAEDVVAFDPETFAAYTEVKAAVVALKGYRSWLSSFDDVTRSIGFSSSQWHQNFLILQPTDVRSYSAIQLAPNHRESAYAAIAP